MLFFQPGLSQRCKQERRRQGYVCEDVYKRSLYTCMEITLNRKTIYLLLEVSQEAHCRFEPEQPFTDTENHSSGKQNKVLEMRSLSPDPQIELPFISLHTAIL